MECDGQDFRQLLDSLSVAGNNMSSKQCRLISLLALHLLDFNRVGLMSRRYRQQRIYRRHLLLYCHYTRQIMEVFNLVLRFVPMLRKPLGIANDINKSVIRLDKDFGIVQPVRSFFENNVRTFTRDEWLSTFRMKRSTFRCLCSCLKNSLKPIGGNVSQKNLISLGKRIALALYAFSTGADYRQVAHLFHVSRTSVCKFMKRFAEAVIKTLGGNLLTMPANMEEYDVIRQAFHETSNMPPLVVGVLGHCEIPVNPVTGSIASFINESGNATIILQALVDDKLLFRKVSMDNQLKLLAENEITQLQQQEINGRKVSCFVVAANSYPLRTWLLHKYTQPLSPHEYNFNNAMERILTIKDRAFRRLFARWKILQRKCDLEPKTMKVIAMACCALHNLLEENEDGYLEEWDNNVDVGQFHTKQPAPSQQPVLRDSRTATEMRDFLARTISFEKM